MTYEEQLREHERHWEWAKAHPHWRCLECHQPRGDWPQAPPDEEQLNTDLCPPCNRFLLGDLQADRRNERRAADTE
jgi:hypothetical protein